MLKMEWKRREGKVVVNDTIKFNSITQQYTHTKKNAKNILIMNLHGSIVFNLIHKDVAYILFFLHWCLSKFVSKCFQTLL